LIIFDEVQMFPRARAAIKYLVADGRYDYIETGSLVSIKNNVKSFGDVSNHWAAYSIFFVAARAIFVGDDQGDFSPDTALTRAMLVQVIANFDGADLTGYTSCSFDDVPDGQWYTAAIQWAAYNGIISGVGNNLFAPDDSVTREQMAVIILNYLNLRNIRPPTNQPYEQYADEKLFSPWAENAIKILQMAKIMKGKTDNLFDPQAVVTRGECAAIFERIITAVQGN